MKTIFKLETSSPADSHEAVIVPAQGPNPALPTASADVRPGINGLPNQPVAADGTRLPRLAYSVKETAEILGVSDKTVRRLVDRGLLKPSRAIRHLLIPLKEIQRFLDNTG